MRLYLNIIFGGLIVITGSCAERNANKTIAEDSVQLNSAVSDTVNIPSLVMPGRSLY